jgi:CRP-like cAMP-binding protein
MPELQEQEENARYSDLIKSLVPVSELSPQIQNQLISQASILTYKKKEFVFKQGDTDDYAFYLLEGQIELLSHNHVESTLVSGTDSARYAMARLQPRQFSVRAKTDIMILVLERTALDRLMVMDQQGREQETAGGAEMEVSHISDEDSGDWMTRLLQSQLFSRLPTANIQKLFTMLEPVEYKAGDTVINQGDAGDYYFIIQEGRCEVTRSPTQGTKFIKLAELHAGDSFGEEALLTNATRNASIRMLTDGVLMRLSKDNFINLIKKPTLSELTYAEAKKLIDGNEATWLDVRYQNEYEESRLEGSLHIPLTILRSQTDKLEKDRRYIICCDTGGRSSAAAFLLTNYGYNVCYLKGGLSSVPQDALEKKSAHPPAPVIKISSPPPLSPAPPVDTPAQKSKHEKIDPGVRKSLLEASLAVTSMALEETMKNQGTQTNDEWQGAQKRLETEKKKLEAEKKSTDKEDIKLREQEEAKFRKLKEESEKRMEEEKKKLEEVYARSTRDMEKYQRTKEAAEEQLRKEREKLERDTAGAYRKIEEARKKLEQETIRKHAEQEAQERALQAKAKASIEESRQKLAQEVTKINEELERARKEKEQSDAARQAAEDEARKIIAEYKQQFEQERTRERARLEEERKKLEEESRKIQDTLKEIQQSRQEAETLRAAALAEAEALRAKQQASGPNQEQGMQRLVAEQIRQVEAKMQQAQQNLESVQKAEIKAKTARVVNAQELQKRKEEEERLRKQIESDVADFESEQKVTAPAPQEVLAFSDHAKRIREQADAAQKKLDDANKNLLNDISSQLGSDDHN